MHAMVLYHSTFSMVDFSFAMLRPIWLRTVGQPSSASSVASHGQPNGNHHLHASSDRHLYPAALIHQIGDRIGCCDRWAAVAALVASLVVAAAAAAGRWWDRWPWWRRWWQRYHQIDRI